MIMQSIEPAAKVVAMGQPQVKKRGRRKYGELRTEDIPEYGVWASMKRRCLNPNCREWKRYGGRGISVCSGFLDFSNYYAILGRRPSVTMQVDRADNDGNYSCGRCSECKEKGWPMNLRWADRVTQTNNTRRNVRVVVDGVSRTVSQWAKLIGIPATLALGRIYDGMDPILAVTLRREEAVKLRQESHRGLGNPNAKPITFNGETHLRIEWAKIIGIDISSLTQRIQKYGIEKALSTPKGVRMA